MSVRRHRAGSRRFRHCILSGRFLAAGIGSLANLAVAVEEALKAQFLGQPIQLDQQLYAALTAKRARTMLIEKKQGFDGRASKRGSARSSPAIVKRQMLVIFYPATASRCFLHADV